MRVDQDSRITVIVNVHNRHRHLSRQLDYLRGHYEHVLVADSSSDEYADKKRLQGVDYYFHSGRDYIEKLCDVIEKVKTPYVHLCADDDFYVPTAVSTCVDFLEQNPDYYSAHGWYAAFDWNGERIQFYPLYKNYINRDINGTTATKRLRQLFSSYIQCLYGVHRTINLRDAFCLAEQQHIANHNLIELLTAITAAVNGKHRVLPVLYGVREKMLNSAGTFTPNIHVVMNQDEHRGEYQRFLELSAGYLSRKAGVPSATAKKDFTKALMLYVLDTDPQRAFVDRISFHKLVAKMRRGPIKAMCLCRGGKLGYIRQVDRRWTHMSRIERMIEQHNILHEA